MLKELLLFIILSPGMLLTLPPVGKGVWMTCKTSLLSVLVHAVIFAILLTYWNQIPFLNQIEGFEDTVTYTTGQAWGYFIGVFFLGVAVVGVPWGVMSYMARKKGSSSNSASANSVA